MIAEKSVETVEIAVSDLIEDAANLNIHPQRSIEAIKDSLKRFGQVEPLIVRKGTNVVIGGNGRLSAMRAMDWDQCSVHYFDGSDDEARALSIALNRTAQFSDFDEARLAAEVQRLAEADNGIDLDALGYDEKELGELISTVNPDSSAKEIDVDDFNLDTTCPKCGFEFNDDK